MKRSEDAAGKVLPIQSPFVEHDDLDLTNARLQSIRFQSISDVLLHFLKRMIVLQWQDSRPKPYKHFSLQNVDRGADRCIQWLGFAQPIDIEYFLRFPRKEKI